VKRDIELVVNSYCGFYQDWFERYALDEITLVDVSATASDWSIFFEKTLPMSATSLRSLNLSHNVEVTVNAAYFSQFVNLESLLLNDTQVSGKFSDFGNLRKIKRLDVNNCPNIAPDFDSSNIECDDDDDDDNLANGGGKTDFVCVSVDGARFNYPICRTIVEVAANTMEENKGTSPSSKPH
jgi:hypothetical protein